MKVIPQTRHSHYISYLRFYFYFTMSVPDESYSTNTSFELHYISSFLLLWAYLMKVITQTRYSHYFVSIFILLWAYLMKVIPQTRHSHYIIIYLRIFVSIFILLWAYLMKVIPQTRHSHYIIHLRFYFYFTWWRLFHKHVIRTTLLSSFLFLFYYDSTNTLFALHTTLFHKHVIHTTLAIFVSIFILLWA